MSLLSWSSGSPDYLSEGISQLRRKRGIHVNPWGHFPRLITSIDFLKRERPLRSFRETLTAGEEAAYPRPYDLLIVDEAHNVAPSGRGRYPTESMRTLAIRRAHVIWCWDCVCRSGIQRYRGHFSNWL